MVHHPLTAVPTAVIVNCGHRQLNYQQPLCRVEGLGDTEHRHGGYF